MPTGLSRRTMLWLADHALPLAGVGLLTAGQVWAGGLTPLGWALLGLAALAWLAESNGYAIPRPGRAPIVPVGCGEVPVAFGVSQRGRHFLLTRGVAPAAGDWPDDYAVFELPSLGEGLVRTSAFEPPADAQCFNARVPATALRFEHHHRSYVDSAALGRALDRVVPRTA